MTGLHAWLIIIGFFAICLLIGSGISKMAQPFAIKLRNKMIKDQMKADIEAEEATNTLWKEAYSELLNERANKAAKRMRKY